MPTTRVYPYQFIKYKTFPWYFTRFITGQDPSYTGPGWKIVESYSRSAGGGAGAYHTPSGGTSSIHLPTDSGFNSSDASNDDGARLQHHDWIMFQTNRGGGSTECQVLMLTYASTSTNASRYIHFYLLPLADYVAGSAKVANGKNIDVKTDQLVVLGTSYAGMSGFTVPIAVGLDTGNYYNTTLAGMATGGSPTDTGTAANTVYIFRLVASINANQRFSIIADEATCSIWYTDENAVDWVHFGLFDSIYDTTDDQRPFLIGGGYNQNNPASANMVRYPPETQVSGSLCLNLDAENVSSLTGYPGQVFGKRPIMPWQIFTYADGHQGTQGYLRLMYQSNDNLGLMGTLKDRTYCYVQVGTQGSSATLVFPWDGVTEL